MCICHKHMLVAANEGTCLWCGHGDPLAIMRAAPAEPRLPRNLGEIDREGRHPDLRCDNVVRLDRLRGAEAA